MILFELIGSEHHPAYQELEVSNGNRQYDFLRSVATAAMAMGCDYLSSNVLKALNYQAIACLHTNAGRYRPCPVTVGKYRPPEHYQVKALMDHFVNQVNRLWKDADPVVLSALVLWRLNAIHPFINGNGRTARAACYFVLCLKAGAWLPGAPILPELIRRERDSYVAALRAADAAAASGSADPLKDLHELLTRLLQEQLGRFPALPNPATTI